MTSGGVTVAVDDGALYGVLDGLLDGIRKGIPREKRMEIHLEDDAATVLVYVSLCST